jgi:hypothetical protein
MLAIDGTDSFELDVQVITDVEPGELVAGVQYGRRVRLDVRLVVREHV